MGSCRVGGWETWRGWVVAALGCGQGCHDTPSLPNLSLQVLPDRDGKRCMFCVKTSSRTYEMSASDTRQRQEWTLGMYHSTCSALSPFPSSLLASSSPGEESPRNSRGCSPELLVPCSFTTSPAPGEGGPCP